MMTNNYTDTHDLSHNSHPAPLFVGTKPKQNNNNNAKKRTQLGKLVKPPAIRPPVINQTFRFMFKSSGSSLASLHTPVASNMIASLLAFNVTTGATQNIYSVIQAFKVRRVSMWSMGPTDEAQTSLAVDFTSNNPAFNSRGQVISDVGMGTAFPAAVNAKPPVGSFAASWVDSHHALSTPYTMFDVRTTSHITYLDLELSYILQDSVHSLALGVTQTAVAHAIQTYYVALDAFTQAVPYWQPQGVANVW
jgi:hypothetical protein